MVKVDGKRAAALCALRSNTEFKVFVEMLVEDAGIELNRVKTLDVPAVYRAQGAATKIDEWLKHIEDAPANLKKLRGEHA
jgi:hypothetical protein